MDVVIRLLILQHIRNWSYAALEREVRANLVYRQFTRVGAAKVPDAKTLGKLGIAIGPQIIDQIHQRVVAIARERGVISGRKMRARRSSRRISTTRPMRRCSGTGFEFSLGP